MSYAENFPPETPDYTVRAVRSVENIVSGMINGRNVVTKEVHKDIIRAAAIMTVPRILGVPLKKISVYEKEIDKLSSWHSGHNY